MAALNVSELGHALRMRVLQTDPKIWAQYQQETSTANVALAETCKRTEEFLAKFGEIDVVRKALDASYAFLRGEITPEELDAARAGIEGEITLKKR